jgi:hypothetical protein
LRTGISGRLEVVADLFDISVRPVFALRLKGEEVDERRLRSLDLRRDDRLLADERVDEPVERGHHLSRQLEANERLLRSAELCLKRLEGEGRIYRREGVPKGHH